VRASVVVLAASLLGCATLVSERDRLGGHALFPLSPGHSWTYQVRDHNGQISEFRARVNRELAGDGGTLTLVEESGGIPGDARFESAGDLVAYYSRGGFVFRAPWYASSHRLTATGNAEPILPIDLAHRPTWQGSHAVLDVEGPPLYQVRTESRVVATDDSIVVPAGRFGNCLRVDTVVYATVPASSPKREIIHYYTDWYAPHVGLVKMESAVATDGGKRELVSLELARFAKED
jgi:hypothetical protein